MRKVEKLWSPVLTALAVLFLIAFSIPAFVTDLTDKTRSAIEIIQWVCWLAFALDLIFGLATSRDKKDYLLKHPLEIASVLLPFLRPLRLMRVISFGSLALQKIAMGKQFAITIKVAVTAVFVSYIAAVQITISERSVEGSNIKTFGDGLWWAITTVTTVGYGDRFPTTTEGRILAVMLMLVGISLVGVITASVASWFVRLSQEESKN
jgi:voltage-gated potassium channel